MLHHMVWKYREVSVFWQVVSISGAVYMVCHIPKTSPGFPYTHFKMCKDAGFYHSAQQKGCIHLNHLVI